MSEHKDIKDMISFTTGEEITEQDPIMEIPENKVVYIKGMEDGRAFVEVDLGLAKVAPVPRLHWLLGIQIELQDADEDGFFTEEEKEKLDKICAEIISSLHAEGHCRYAGAVTYAGMHMLYFYGKDESYLPPLVGNIAAKYDEYDINFMSENDGHWAFYYNALYPQDIDMAHIRNREILQQLVNNGWDLDQEYPVYYFFYFQEGPDRAQATALFKLHGFEIVDDHIYDQAFEPMPMGLKIMAKHKLDFMTVTEKTYDVHEIMDAFIGVIDGWEIALDRLQA